MPFQNKSTLVQPATSNFPIRQWLDTRDPVSGANGDYKNFQIFDIWINEASQNAWIMVDRTATSGTWIQMASSGTGILTITGDAGGAVGPDGANNINLLSGDNLTVTGTPGTNTLTITLDGTVADSYPTDSGTAIPALGVLNVVGGMGASTSGAGNTITINAADAVPLTFTEDSGSATPAANNINIFGGTAITTSGAGDTVTISLDGDVADQYTCDSGIAVPSGNNLNVFGAGGISTTGAGDTITITGGVAWNVITVVGPTSMSCNNGYIANSASRVQLTLPLTAAVGCIIRVVGLNTGGWQINQNASQNIRIVDSVSTTGVGGMVQSSEANAALTIVCVVANTSWIALSSAGNLIVT
jgi:hypothetical protein